MRAPHRCAVDAAHPLSGRGSLNRHTCGSPFRNAVPCAGATTYHAVLNVNRGLSWDDAVAYRDAALAQAVDAGEELDRNVGFYTDRFVKDHGKTGARPLDVFLCKFGFFATIPNARQWTHHGKISRNRKIVTCPTDMSKPADVVSISASNITPLRESLEDPYSSPRLSDLPAILKGATLMPEGAAIFSSAMHRMKRLSTR